MVRLVFFLLLGAAAWYGWRVVRRHLTSISRDLKDAEDSLAREKTVELERDPKTGVYRPSDRRD